MSLPTVVLAGRPNVGKSTLFNRLAGRRTAIVEPVPGVTRDVIETEVAWGGRRFRLLDTGGLLAGPQSPALGERAPATPPRSQAGSTIEAAVRQRAWNAASQAAVIVFVVDARAGLTAGDKELAAHLRRLGRPLLVAANKTEADHARFGASEFYALGLGEPLAISAEHGLGIDDLFDEVAARLPAETPDALADDPAPVPPAGDAATGEHPLKIAIVGRPNVGKSSLVNRLLGEDRVIVADQPGTTRDAVDVAWRAYGRTFVLIDTAGQRRKARVRDARDSVEFYSTRRAERAVERCDVAILVIDATEGLTAQDQRIAGAIREAGKAAIVLLNKWDAVPAEARNADQALLKVRQGLPFLAYALFSTVSALSGQRVGRLAEQVERVARAQRFTLATADLNRFLRDAQLVRQPPAVHGKPLRLYYGTQVATAPPTLLVFVNDPARMHFSYERYLDNRLREAHDLQGTPIRWLWRARPSERSARPRPTAGRRAPR